MTYIKPIPVKKKILKLEININRGNNTKIKYLKAMNKLYQVTRMSFYYMVIEATETDLSLDDVPPDEVWDIEDFKNYKIRLINNGGQAEIIDFSKWKRLII